MSDPVDKIRQLVENQRVVENLQRAATNAPLDIGLLRSSLRQAIETRAWAERLERRTGQTVKFNTLADFVTTKPVDGLGSDVATILRLLGPPGECPERETFVNEITPGRGGNKNPDGRNQHAKEVLVNHDNIMIDQIAAQKIPAAVQGTSIDYAVRRLSRERPELLEEVKAGKKSCHAAMVEAGFRKVPTPLDNLRRAWARASKAERETFMTEVGQEGW